MIEACGMCEQKEEAAKIFQDIKKDSIEPSVDTFNAYFQACGKALKTERKKSGEIIEAKMTVEEEKLMSKNIEEERKIREKLIKVLHKSVIELTNKCLNPACDRYLREEEIITAWSRNLQEYSIKCPACGTSFVPKLEIQYTSEKTKTFYFLFPPLLYKEFNNLIENKSANIFFKVFFKGKLMKIAGIL